MIDSSATESSASSALPSRGSGLPPLDKPTSFMVPKINRPVRMPKAVDAWYRLQRIECVDVVSTQGASNSKDMAFAVNVFLRHNQNRIPSNNIRTNELTSLLVSNALASSPVPNANPDFHVIRSSAEFEALRTSIWESVRQYHPVYCELCNGLTIQMLTSLSNPTFLSMTIYRAPAKRAKKMRKFLLSILTDLHEKKSMCVPACRGQSELPLLLHGFLFGDDDAQSAGTVNDDSSCTDL